MKERKIVNCGTVKRKRERMKQAKSIFVPFSLYNEKNPQGRSRQIGSSGVGNILSTEPFPNPSFGGNFHCFKNRTKPTLNRLGKNRESDIILVL